MSKHICMLAHLYDPKRVIFPAYIQPKLDGVRAIWLHKEKRFVSRNNKPLVLNSNLISELIKFPFDIDGELIVPGRTFNEISGIVRHQDVTELKECIMYVVFDIIDSSTNYLLRLESLENFKKNRSFAQIDFLKRYIVFSYQDIEMHHNMHLHQGYEGSIIRNNTPYEFKRSFNLLKIKPTKEIICKIIGLIEGTGKYEGMLGALTVETLDKKIFNVGSGFTDRERYTIWNLKREDYFYRSTLVKYQDLSEYGIPRFPIFKGFKE